MQEDGEIAKFVAIGSAYMGNTEFVQKMRENGSKMSVLYIRRMLFSMYAFDEMLYIPCQPFV